jgi:Zn-dependent M28 family amino/carboxypeptidase
LDITSLEKQILGDLWTSPALWNSMLALCDSFNSRFAGTDEERAAGDYIMDCFKRYGLQNVHPEAFEMPGWERGTARLALLDGSAEIVVPCLALPGSPSCDLEAEIIDVGNGGPDEYARLSTPAAGKIVLTNSDGLGRMEKYMAAVESGVAAFIFGSNQPGMLAPTGSIGKDTPAIGLAYEHAARIHRLLAKGPLRVRLTLTSAVHIVTARNIVGEIPGADPSQGWIVACGHYDGHDIAQGAGDNAAGSAVVMEAARLLAPLREHLQVGLRFVLFSGEELGLFGSYAYAAAHADEMDTLRAIFNVDVVGMAMPLVLLPQSSPELTAWVRTLPLTDLDVKINDAPKVFIMNSDHFPFSEKGVQAVWAVTSHPASGGGWGHTAADTLDKVEPRLLRQTAASATRLLLRMATAPDSLPRTRKTPDQVKQSLIDAGFEKSLRFKNKWPF